MTLNTNLKNILLVIAATLMLSACSTAKKSGNIAENGKLMFIYQALAAFNIWHQLNLEIDDETIDLLNL